MAKLKGGTRIYGDIKIDGGIYDSSNQVGLGGSVLISTGVGIGWTTANLGGGSQGTQGTQGTQGLQGLQGNQGLSNQGTQGTQATQGLQGLQGNQGNQGRQGTQGTQGLQGLQGNQGLSNQGFQGTQGTQATQGLQGLQGNQGLSNQGTQGTQATQGLQGLQGNQGNQGRQGTQGTQGLQGLQGTQGLQGNQGSIGIQGNQGVSGFSAANVGKVFYYDFGSTSDVVGFSTALANPSTQATSTQTVALSGSTTTLLSSFISLPGTPGVTDLPAGSGTHTIYAQVSSGSASLTVEIYKSNSTGSSLIGISTATSQPFSFTTPTVISWNYTLSSATLLNVTDRLAFRIYATRVSGPTNIDITVSYEGTTTQSNALTTIASGSAGAQGLQGLQGIRGSAQGTQGTKGNFTVYNQSTAPSSPQVGDYWIDDTDGTTYFYYNDGTSSQWVEFGATPQQYIVGGGGGGSGKFDTSIDNVLFSQPTGTLDIVGVGTTTSQITTLTSSSPKYIVHSMHVTNVTSNDSEITAGFVDASRKISTTVSTGAGSSGGAGINTFSVASSAGVRIGMAVTGTGNIGETTGIGTTAGFQYNTYVTSVDNGTISISKPMSGYAVGNVFFTPVSKVVSRLPMPAYASVELLKQPMILNSLDSIVLQSTGISTGIGSTSTSVISQTNDSNILTVTAGAAITNFIAPGMLVLATGINTGIQTNTFVANYSSGSLSVPLTRPATLSLANTAFSFTEVVVPADGTNQVTVVYQTSSDTSYQDGMGTVVGIVNTNFIVGVTSSVPNVYYGTGLTYPSIVQSIRISNISDSTIYPGGDYKVSVGIGNSDTILSWLAYDMVVPKNSSIELCEAPKRLGIGQSIFAAAEEANTIEIQIAAKQDTQ